MAARKAKAVGVDLSKLPKPESFKSLRAVWDAADQYRMTPRQHGYPENIVRLWAPVDAIHEIAVAACMASRISLASAMFGWDDSEINDLFIHKLRDEHVPVQLSLDSTQAAGKGEVPLVKKWAGIPGNSLAIGHSVEGAISHGKNFVIDGVLTIGGSTNFSIGGETKQNNEFYMVWDAVYAAETSARLSVIHDQMLMQMAAKQSKLVVDYASKQSTLTAAQKKAMLAGDYSSLPA